MKRIDDLKCLNCGKQLRRYKWRIKPGEEKIDGFPPEMQFGDNGDNLFCGLNCGYRWAVASLRQTKEFEVREEIALAEVKRK